MSNGDWKPFAIVAKCLNSGLRELDLVIDGNQIPTAEFLHLWLDAIKVKISSLSAVLWSSGKIRGSSLITDCQSMYKQNMGSPLDPSVELRQWWYGKESAIEYISVIEFKGYRFVIIPNFRSIWKYSHRIQCLKWIVWLALLAWSSWNRRQISSSSHKDGSCGFKCILKFSNFRTEMMTLVSRYMCSSDMAWAFRLHRIV